MTLASLVLDQIPGLRFTLDRIADEHVQVLKKSRVKIACAQSTLDIKHFSGYHGIHYMNLAESFVTLSRWFGPSDREYDPATGSFSFPFLLRVAKNNGDHLYMIDVHDYLGNLDIAFFKLQPGSLVGSSEKITAKAFARGEIRKFIVSFYGYLLGLLNHIPQNKLTPFVHDVPAGRILYGCLDQKFFQERFTTQAGFETARKARLRHLCRQEVAFWARPMRRPGMEMTGSGLKLTVKL